MVYVISVGRLFVGVLCALSALNTEAAARATPISKVLDLLQELLTKGEAAKKEEAVKYAAFNQWCGDQTRMRKDEISSLEGTMEKLSASIQKRAVHIDQLTARIDELDDDVVRWNKDDKATVDIRSKESTDFKSTNMDYTESLSALDEAIGILKKQSYNREQASKALLQIRSLLHKPRAAKVAVAAFLQDVTKTEPDLPDDRLFKEAPEAYGYNFQSGGVVDMLVKLKSDFSTQKKELEAEELSAQHNHNLIRQQLADNIENAEHEISSKKTTRAETQKQKADEEGQLAEATNDRDESQRYLAEMTGMCNVKAADFESRQKLRNDELVAIQKALEIIQSSGVAGAGDKHLPAFVQTRAGKATSLAQVKRVSASPLQERIAAFLAHRARESGSSLLAEVSQRVAGGDTFKKVKKLIKDLIVRLMEEATAETEHKGWCDTELATNKQTRDAKTESVNQLTTEIEDLTAEIAQLAQDIADLADGIKELQAAMAKATGERTQAKATNEQTIKDAKEAQTAVGAAISVLKDFYAKSAEATALVQQAPAEDAPETFTGPYKGMLPEGGSVVDFLEVVLSDFARLESETAANEALEAKEYDGFMFESKKSKALKENEKGHKENKKVEQEGALHSAQEELKVTQEELNSAVAYYEKLKPSCVDSGITYEERVKKREAEMQSLQEALNILTAQDIDLQ